ncbi:MAG: hypothetical protein HYV28_17310 [Ignavibacteriales bacterium]|nr:hypothetical protein [Ignavibacteriales bacterium]
MKRIIIVAAIVFAFTLSITAQQNGPKHKIYVQYTGKKTEFLKVWLDSTVIISDSIKASSKMPPIIRIIGIANLYQYTKLTMVVGKKAYAAKFEKGIMDIVLNPSDTARPIVLYKQRIKQK